MQTILDELNKAKRASFSGCGINLLVRRLNLPLGDRLREKIKKWLCPPDPSINHNTACKAHKDGTATWFLEGSMYNKWKATGSLVWIHGNRTNFNRSRTITPDCL